MPVDETAYDRLFPFQRDGAQFLAARSVALLADEMGLGKTPQAIVASDLVWAVRILVLCPNIAVTNWRRSFEEWRPMGGYEVEIVGHATLAGSGRVFRQLMKSADWDLLIVDEAQAYKDPRAVRTQRLYGHRMSRQNCLAGKAERVWLLSGTPMPNHPGELYPHLKTLWPHLPVVAGKRYWDFVDRFCDVRETPFGRTIQGARNTAELVNTLRPIILRRRTRQVLQDLPPIAFVSKIVDAAGVPPADAHSDRLLAAALAKGSDDETMKDLRSLVFGEHIARLRQQYGTAKVPAVIEHVRELREAGEQVVVFGHHTNVIESIAAAFGDDAASITGQTPRWRRQHLVDRFQAKEIGVLVCNLSIASTALTLTAARHVVFAETSWVPADVQQAAKRCHRIGQDRPVLATIISLAGSIDEQVNGVLIRKARDLRQVDEAITTEAA